MNDDDEMFAKVISAAFPKKTPEEEAAEDARWAVRDAEHTAWKLKQAEETRLAVSLEIKKLHKESAEKIVEAERLTRLLAAYPDLLIHHRRGGYKHYYSKAVNNLVNKVDFSHSCSCGSCHDSPLDVWLYLETPDGPVYSNPVKFYVGREGPYGGDIPKKGWQTTLRDAGIPEAIVTQVKEHFRKSAEDAQEQASYAYRGYATDDDDETPI
jgi:hypothetical protein